MSWRSGGSLFIEIRPAIQKHIPERDIRVEFTAELLKVFVGSDMDTYDVEDVHPDVRAAMRHAGLELSDPERYKEQQGVTPGGMATVSETFSKPANRTTIRHYLSELAETRQNSRS